MNMNTKLEDIIADALQNVANPDAIDFFFTPDWLASPCGVHDMTRPQLTDDYSFELNAGSFITRATPRSHKFFQRSIDYHEANNKDEDQLSEQDCMRDVMFGSPSMKDQFIMLPQHSINAFPEEIGCFDSRYEKHYEPGMFFIHFAGAWAHVREEDPTGFLMRKYEPEIVYED